jgi:hypothetical protein
MEMAWAKVGRAESLSGRKTVLQQSGSTWWKGKPYSGDPVIVVAKLSITGKLVIITVYLV